MRFVKGQSKIITSIQLNDNNFMQVMAKLNMQEKLDSFGKNTSLDLYLADGDILIIEYKVVRHTISECRAVVKGIKKDFALWFNGKCQLVMDAEGKN
jgi:hypothetical protein